MNAQSLLNRVQEDTIDGANTPISNLQDEDQIYYFRNWFDDLNNNFNAKDLSSANAEMLLRQNKYKYLHDEAMANTQIQRRVADLLKAGLNPYLANGLLGGSGGFAGELPQNAASASSSENRQKLDWRNFAAQSGMNIIQSIISATMSGFAMYQTQKALMAAKDDHDNNGGYNGEKWNKSDNSFNKTMSEGARGLADGLMDMNQQLPKILGSLFGIPFLRWNF